jgi:hypothetical protein
MAAIRARKGTLIWFIARVNILSQAGGMELCWGRNEIKRADLDEFFVKIGSLLQK